MEDYEDPLSSMQCHVGRWALGNLTFDVGPNQWDMARKSAGLDNLSLDLARPGPIRIEWHVILVDHTSFHLNAQRQAIEAAS